MSGKSVTAACKEVGLTEQSYYRYRKEYGGLNVEHARPDTLDIMGWSVVLLPKGSPYCLSDAGRSPKPRALTGTKGDQCFRAKYGESSAGQSWVARKTEIADAGFDPGFCVVRIRTQG